MELENYLTAFKTPLGVRICVVLGDKELPLNQILKGYSEKFKETKNRETVYRVLEKLVKHEIVDKMYDKETKKIIYKLKIREAKVDFVTKTLVLEP